MRGVVLATERRFLLTINSSYLDPCRFQGSGYLHVLLFELLCVGVTGRVEHDQPRGTYRREKVRKEKYTVSAVILANHIKYDAADKHVTSCRWCERS